MVLEEPVGAVGSLHSSTVGEHWRVHVLVVVGVLLVTPHEVVRVHRLLLEVVEGGVVD